MERVGRFQGNTEYSLQFVEQSLQGMEITEDTAVAILHSLKGGQVEVHERADYIVYRFLLDAGYEELAAEYAQLSKRFLYA